MLRINVLVTLLPYTSGLASIDINTRADAGVLQGYEAEWYHVLDPRVVSTRRT
jgi:hypothetical protein